MAKRKRPLKRQSNPLRDARLIVIACEDRYAVKQYFDFFKSTRIQVVVLPTGSDNLSSPEHVFHRLNEYLEEYQIGKGDAFWLICDCDHWIEPNHIQNLTSVLTLCRQKKINFAICRPCFELWLLLHFEDFPLQPLGNCDAVISLIRKSVGSYNKTRVDQLPISDSHVQKAIERAKTQAVFEDIPKTPQTTIHMIVEQLQQWGAITLLQQ